MDIQILKSRIVFDASGLRIDIVNMIGQTEIKVYPRNMKYNSIHIKTSVKTTTCLIMTNL